jgi:hypothetical protein
MNEIHDLTHTHNRAQRRAAARKARRATGAALTAGSAALAATAGLIATAAPAGAATFVVDNLDDSGGGSLRQAVLDANAAGGADDIAFAEGLTGTITLESQIDVTDELTINGPGASVITVSGGGDSRIFESTAPFTVRGLTLADAGPDSDDCRDDSGGAIRQLDFSLEVASSVFSGNSGGYGASVYMYDDVTANISGSTFVGNVSNDGCDGPAVYSNEAGDVTITTSTFEGNTATGDEAGAVWLCPAAGATNTITNSTFTDNHATDGNGGAILVYQCGESDGVGGSHLLVANSTITGNTATATGGGIAFYSEATDATLTILQSTITDNTAGLYGGGVAVYGEAAFAVTITGSIITDNENTGEFEPSAATAEDNGPDNVGVSEVGALAAGPSDLFSEIPDLPSGDNNIIGALEGATELSGNENQFGVDPLLGPLADNGGPTQTRALLDSSPALNAGPDPVPDFPGNEFDQRSTGFLRVVFGRVDVGAYEVQAPVEPIVLQPTFTG